MTTKNMPIHLQSNQSVWEGELRRKRLGKEIGLEPRMEHTMRQVDSRFRVGAWGQRGAERWTRLIRHPSFLYRQGAYFLRQVGSLITQTINAVENVNKHKLGLTWQLPKKRHQEAHGTTDTFPNTKSKTDLESISVTSCQTRFLNQTIFQLCLQFKKSKSAIIHSLIDN